MGASNVAAVYAQYSTHKGVNDVAFRLLTFMANTALDDARPPRFWGGRDAMAHAIGRVVPEAPAADDESAEAQAARKERAAAFQAVKRALQILVDAGALTRAKTGRAGVNAEYHLNLNPPTTADQLDLWTTDAQGYAPRTPERYAPRTDRGTSHVPAGVRPTYPQGYTARTPKEKRGTRDEQGGRDSTFPTTHQAAAL